VAHDALAIVGVVGLAAVLASAIVWAATAPTVRASSIAVRSRLVLLCLLGPLARSYARDFRCARAPLDISADPPPSRAGWKRSSSVAFANLRVDPGDESAVEQLTGLLRAALLKRGAIVALTDGYQPYDLEIRTADGAAAALNLLNARDGRIVVGWKLGAQQSIATRRFGALLVVVAGILYLGGGPDAAVLAAMLGSSAIAIVFLLDARRLPSLIELAVREAGVAYAAYQPVAAQGAAV
jgi:hypothetical protein